MTTARNAQLVRETLLALNVSAQVSQVVRETLCSGPTTGTKLAVGQVVRETLISTVRLDNPGFCSVIWG